MGRYRTPISTNHSFAGILAKPTRKIKSLIQFIKRNVDPNARASSPAPARTASRKRYEPEVVPTTTIADLKAILSTVSFPSRPKNGKLAKSGMNHDPNAYGSAIRAMANDDIFTPTKTNAFRVRINDIRWGSNDNVINIRSTYAERSKMSSTPSKLGSAGPSKDPSMVRDDKLITRKILQKTQRNDVIQAHSL